MYLIFVLLIEICLYRRKFAGLLKNIKAQGSKAQEEDKCSGSYRKPKEELNSGQIYSETMRHQFPL